MTQSLVELLSRCDAKLDDSPRQGAMSEASVNKANETGTQPASCHAVPALCSDGCLHNAIAWPSSFDLVSINVAGAHIGFSKFAQLEAEPLQFGCVHYESNLRILPEPSIRVSSNEIIVSCLRWCAACLQDGLPRFAKAKNAPEDFVGDATSVMGSKHVVGRAKSVRTAFSHQTAIKQVSSNNSTTLLDSECNCFRVVVNVQPLNHQFEAGRCEGTDIGQDGLQIPRCCCRNCFSRLRLFVLRCASGLLLFRADCAFFGAALACPGGRDFVSVDYRLEFVSAAPFCTARRERWATQPRAGSHWQVVQNSLLECSRSSTLGKP